MITQFQAKRKLARSIRNDKRNYRQDRFTIGPINSVPADCDTACCIAGHIEANWPGTTHRLIAQDPDKYLTPPCNCSVCVAAGARAGKLDHQLLAADVWEAVTGKPCRFDFSSGPGVLREANGITREDAVAHIYGRHKQWPLKEVESV